MLFFTALLIWTELGAVAAAAIWAIAGYFHMGVAVEVVLALIIGLPVAYLAGWLTKSAYDAEIHPEPDE